MNKKLLTVLAAVMAGSSLCAQAQAPAAPAAPPPPPAPRIPLALAIEASEAALADCKAKTYLITALVVDSAGVPVVMMSEDGNAAARTQGVAKAKIATVMKYKVPSGQIVERVKTDTALAAEVKANPDIGDLLRQGGVPIMVGGKMVGAMAGSGAPGGDKDEACVITGLGKIQARLK